MQTLSDVVPVASLVTVEARASKVGHVGVSVGMAISAPVLAGASRVLTLGATVKRQ